MINIPLYISKFESFSCFKSATIFNLKSHLEHFSNTFNINPNLHSWVKQILFTCIYCLFIPLLLLYSPCLQIHSNMNLWSKCRGDIQYYIIVKVDPRTSVILMIECSIYILLMQKRVKIISITVLTTIVSHIIHSSTSSPTWSYTKDTNLRVNLFTHFCIQADFSVTL